MRVAWLVVLAAGCFSPEPPPGQQCTTWCPPPESCIANTCRIDEGELTPNYAFVTSDRREMWTQTPASLDLWCDQRARAQNLAGQYIAWVSTSTRSVGMQFTAFAPRGWIRPDGKPFADRIQDVLAGKTYYPLRIADDGSDVGALDENVATATEADGRTAGLSCDDFNAPQANTEVQIGKADAGTEAWTSAQAALCSAPAHIYCFGIDRSNEVAQPPVLGKRIFVTKNAYMVRSAADADLICRNEAGTSGFAALVATTTQSVQQKFAASTGPWSRVDGVLVTEDMRTFTAPVEVAFDGTRVRDEVWFGAKSLTDTATSDRNCNDWSTGAMATTGHSVRSIAPAAFDLAPRNCGSQYHYYCAEL